LNVTAAAQAPRLSIVVVQGEGSINIIQQGTATAPVVEVRDRNNQPVSGALVRFAIRDGRATFSGARTLTATTNAAGRATVSGFAPTSSGALQISATATFQGQTAAVTIAQTNVMTAAQAASMAGASGAGGSGGAAAAGAGSGGGLSATTIGILGGAVAGGTIAARAVLSSGSEYRGPFEGQLVSTIVVGGGVTSQPIVCTLVAAWTGTLTLHVDIAADGSAGGDGDIEGDNTFVSTTCGGGGKSGSFALDTEPVSGTAGSLVARWVQTTTHPASAAAPTGETYTSTWSFSGNLTGDDITGSLTQSDRNDQPRTPSFVGSVTTGSTTYNVTLHKQ
jgi:hypothetical protein